MIVIDAKCPHCLKPLNRTLGLDPNDEPNEGDVSLCFSCGKWAIFEVISAELALREPTTRELIEIANDPHCRAATLAWVRN